MQTRTKLVGFILTVLLAAGLGACATAGASTGEGGEAGAETETTQAAIGVRKPKHVEVAMMSAHQMLSGEAEQSADRVDIVTCGPAIRTLAEDSDRADLVREGLEAGIRIKACGVTVERMGFDQSTFIDGIEVVPNGFVELIRLQEQGFHTIEL